MPRKPKPLGPIYSLAIADPHMSGRPSYVTLKFEKHAITVLRYMFGSVYMSLLLHVACGYVCNYIVYAQGSLAQYNQSIFSYLIITFNVSLSD